MTDDEILLIVDTECPSREYVRIMTNQDLIDFAEAVAHRTLTNQKAKWYQIGAEAERHDIVKMVEHEKEVWDTQIYVRERLDVVAAKIRARGK